MKKCLIFAASALALAGCSSDDFLGDAPGNNGNANSVINFSGKTGKISRATTGESAATKLNKNFIVYGYKTTNDAAQTVYDHYSVNYLGADNNSLSNTAGWEYVGQEKNTALNKTTGAQDIKYWDYSASQYDFIAFSFGEAKQGEGDNQVKATRVDNTKPSYTLTGSAEELAKCFIADRVTAKKDVTDAKDYKLYAYGKQIGFNFRSLSTKVKIGIYEIIPGYSVKDVKFYTDAEDANPTTTPTLYADNKNIPDGKGTMTVTFGSTTESDTDFNQAMVNWKGESDNASTITFDVLSTVNKVNEAKGDKFIGQDITNASKPTDYKTVLPGTDVGALNLKVDYTLESTDGSGEEIKVTGATAVVPAEYTNWQPNYAYTYIFKISDKTNGSTGPGSTGLYPITFDAVVTETENGQQNTITAVETPSITTYAKGKINNENEYEGGSNIYVSVEKATLHIQDTNKEEDKTATNCALYKVTTTGSYTATEALVELCLSKGIDGADDSKTLKEGNNSITVTPVSASDTDKLSIVAQIDGTDTADGNAIKGNFAKFTAATTATTYAFKYYTDSTTAYKVIKVAAKTSK